jgi:hypothetical protein
MILGLVSIIFGVLVLMIIYPYSFDSFSSITTYLALVLLIVFGSRIFYVDFKQYLKHNKEKDVYLAEMNQQLSLNQIPDYPSYEVIRNSKVLRKVTKLITFGQIKNAQPILNNDIAFKASQLKFMFFSWLFKENDEYRIYKTWKKVYKRINAATYDVISNLIDDLKQGSYLVDIANSKTEHLTSGSYILKQENQTWTLIKIPIHTKYVADDFYGMMIYDQSIDQAPYVFLEEDILTKKEQHIKQTTRFFLDIEGKKYKKDEMRDAKCVRVKLKNQEGFDLISYKLPF